MMPKMELKNKKKKTLKLYSAFEIALVKGTEKHSKSRAHPQDTRDRWKTY